MVPLLEFTIPRDTVMEQTRLLFTFKEVVGAMVSHLKMSPTIVIIELKPMLVPQKIWMKFGMKETDSLVTSIST